MKKVGDANTVYVLGHDVLAQATDSNAPKYLLYDGHGSVRQVVQSSSVIGSFAYDAYGNARNFTPENAATKLLYAGEMYDSTAAQYYLRARWYSPTTGRFNRMDPFAGNNRDPQSLHKYLYAHCNPINSIDPTGQMSLAMGLALVGIGALVISIILPSLRGAWRQAQSVASAAGRENIFLAIFKGEITVSDWKRIASGLGSGAHAGLINALDTLTFRQVSALHEYRDTLWRSEGLDQSWVGSASNAFAWVGTASLYAAAAVWTWSALGGGTMDIAVSKAGSPYFFHVQYGVNGVWQHAVGSIGNMWILPVRNVTGVLITGIPVLYPQAVMDAQTAFSCATAAISALARGWGG